MRLSAVDADDIVDDEHRATHRTSHQRPMVSARRAALLHLTQT
ncbi:hypothetical protein [Cellulomonas sp. B6]|nr:hypothetical protein [Cellulomonas sp. B6]